MLRAWNTRIEVYPHSTGEGAEKDVEACGGKFHDHVVGAETVDDALSRAVLIAIGISVNPRVWKAFVVKLEVV